MENLFHNSVDPLSGPTLVDYRKDDDGSDHHGYGS